MDARLFFCFFVHSLGVKKKGGKSRPLGPSRHDTTYTPFLILPKENENYSSPPCSNQRGKKKKSTGHGGFYLDSDSLSLCLCIALVSFAIRKCKEGRDPNRGKEGVVKEKKPDAHEKR